MENDLDSLSDELLQDATVREVLRVRGAELISARKQAEIDKGLDAEISVCAQTLKHLLSDPKSSVKDMAPLLERALQAQRRKSQLR